jgi:chromosome segregation ATPase
MARELNRELFANRMGADAQGTNQNPAQGQNAPQTHYAKAEDIRQLYLHVESVSKRLKEFETALTQIRTKQDSGSEQSKMRFERVQGHFQRQTEMVQTSFSDIHQKIAQVVSRLNERRLSENVVKEMVDRHSQAVQAFEVRLQQVQKVISEQEMQLMNARSELREALQELAKLKRL